MCIDASELVSGEYPLFYSRKHMEHLLQYNLNDEQLENLENILLEAKDNLPDDEEEFLSAHEDSPAGTIRELLEQMARQTNRGVAPSEYMNCEV